MRAWWEAGDTHYLPNISHTAVGRCTHEGDVVPIRDKWFERGTYTESF